MAETDIPQHFVSTREEAWELARAHDRFWVSNCGCREDHGACARSRIDVCLAFRENAAGGRSGRREVSRADVSAIFDEAFAKHLVTRPFRGDDRTQVDGICFCCDDCCWYFAHPEDNCDRGAKVAVTNREGCLDCGVCPDVCYFHARWIDDRGLIIDPDRCYGCGLCLDVCTSDCITMVDR